MVVWWYGGMVVWYIAMPPLFTLCVQSCCIMLFSRLGGMVAYHHATSSVGPEFGRKIRDQGCKWPQLRRSSPPFLPGLVHLGLHADMTVAYGLARAARTADVTFSPRRCLPLGVKWTSQ